MLTLDKIRNSQNKERITTITLAPLTATDINHLFADSLSCTLKEALPLTQLIYQKTQGNPFFSLQKLKKLHAQGHITFAPELARWRYDLNQVRNLKLTDNVVEFMVIQLQKLPAATQDILKLAACIGNTFDLATLAIVNEKSLVETAANLWSALAEGLILPRSQTYKFFQQENIESQLNNSCKFLDCDDYVYDFLHDRVQQAAYSLIDEKQKQITHLQIGQLLLKNISIAEHEEHIFEIVNHLNMGLELITEPTDKEQVAWLNLQAGLKAKASTAYATASQYLAIATQLLADNSWIKQYELTFDIYK